MMEKKLFLNGRKSILEILQQQKLRVLVLNIFISSSQKVIISECEKLRVPYTVKSKTWLSALQKELNAKYSDAFAFLKSKKQITFSQLLDKLSSSNDSPELIVMVDKVHDPHNFGAIIRTCVAAGVNYIISPASNNVRLNSATLKTSQGYALQINLISVPNLSNSLEKLKKLNFWSYAASLNSESKVYCSIKFAPRSILILGNEGHGISKHLESLVDWKIMIPLKNKVDSLNVSVAGGILIYEWMRQFLLYQTNSLSYSK